VDYASSKKFSFKDPNVKGSYSGSSMHLVGGRRGNLQQKKNKGFSKIFKAKYKGTCSFCAGEIKIGQAIMIEQKNKKTRHAYTNSCRIHLM